MSPSIGGSALDARRLIWLDGLLVDGDVPVVGAEDSAFAKGLGVYTSALVTGGAPRFGERHAQRLRRDAETLGLGRVDVEECLEGLAMLGAARFGEGSGIVRLQASCGRDGRISLCGVARECGPARPAWQAHVSRWDHPGPAAWGGAKVTGQPAIELARREAIEAGADEALLFDSRRRVVEGARSNLVAVLGDGTLATPPRGRGAVDGIALGIVRERARNLVERDLSLDDLLAARAIVALNAVRGALPIDRIDGTPIAGADSALAAELSAFLDDAA